MYSFSRSNEISFRLATKRLALKLEKTVAEAKPNKGAATSSAELELAKEKHLDVERPATAHMVALYIASGRISTMPAYRDPKAWKVDDTSQETVLLVSTKELATMSLLF